MTGFEDYGGVGKNVEAWEFKKCMEIARDDRLERQLRHNERYDALAFVTVTLNASALYFQLRFTYRTDVVTLRLRS